MNGQLEVVVAVSTLAVQEVRRAKKEGLDVGTAGRVVLVVARVVDDAELDVKMVAAVGFLDRDDAVVDIEVVEGIVAVDIQALVDGVPRLVAVEGDAGDPAPVARTDPALRREFETDVIAPHQVETVAVHDLVQVRDEQGGGAVEAVEVGRLVAQIRQVGGNAQTPDQGLAVEIGVEH